MGSICKGGMETPEIQLLPVIYDFNIFGGLHYLRVVECPNAKVADLIDANGRWRWGVLGRLLPYEILLRIAAIKPPMGLSYDIPG
ncbi:hypothetical protein V6N11_004852 [Hibiscus sabdariffa]|uniref:Uncharacterized protein n=1 Tax=Hibiscus sabdariffa TaxID=183260 RepID=A0ABR2SID8_9ROSI